MNEQLIVKNFGPIKDATVDFKRVTVFIGPTGGGKSTLAKLAAIFRDVDFYKLQTSEERGNFFSTYSFKGFFNENAKMCWSDLDKAFEITGSLEFSPDFTALNNRVGEITANKKFSKLQLSLGHIMFEHLTSDTGRNLDIKDDILTNKLFDLHPRAATKAIEVVKLLSNAYKQTNPIYIPSERGFAAAIEYSIAGLVRDDIGIPKILLDFTNSYSTSRREISELTIPFLNVKYIHQEGKDLVQTGEDGVILNLYQTASGVQSVTPLLVVLEKLCKNTERPQSFIIEEPELNLYPTAQQGLLNWLVEKCTKGENDLTITTHSPYILSHLNLLLYAHHVGTKDEEKRQKVAAIIPEHYWINPDEFAAYYVNGPEGAGGVRSLLDPETKLISQNELDTVSGMQADEFDQLLDINRGF